MLEKQRERQRRYMEKKKNRDQDHPGEYQMKVSKSKSPKVVIQTRKSIKSKKEYNRIKKQESRARMSVQKKNWMKKKDRETKRVKRQQITDTKRKLKTSLTNIEKTPFSSKKTEWNVTSKVRQAFPSSPRKFVKVLDNLQKHLSPHKKAVMETISVKNDEESLIKTLKKTPKGKSALKEVARQYKNKSRRFVAKKLEMNRRTISLNQVPGGKRCNAVNETIKNFYFREDISRVLPQKRYTTNAGPGYLMQVTVSEAHALYNKEHKLQVSLGRFAAKRPKNVRKLDINCREFCCCVYCINIRKKMLTLSRHVKRESKVTSEGKICEMLLCPKSDAERFFKIDCINGTCKTCGPRETRRQKLDIFYQEISDETALTWSRWTYTEVDKKKKRILTTRQGKKHELLEEFLKDIEEPTLGTSFFQHLNTANWQTMQFTSIKHNLPENCLLQVMDFARNREVKYQDEIKSVYYSKEQITMHPIVSYYKSQNGTVRESDIIISEDINHDYHAVQHYQDIVYNHLVSTWREPEENVVFSDGCSAQYKSKGPFRDLANLNRKVNRNFYGSEHGKGDCDAETGVINKAIDRAINGNKVIINNALDTFHYCRDHLEINDVFSKRKFFFVKKGDINREKQMDIKTLSGTRKLHQIQNDPANPGVLYTRELSCFCCKPEQRQSHNTCINSKSIQPYKRIQLQSFEQNASKLKSTKETTKDTEIQSHGDEKLQTAHKGYNKRTETRARKRLQEKQKTLSDKTTSNKGKLETTTLETPQSTEPVFTDILTRLEEYRKAGQYTPVLCSN